MPDNHTAPIIDIQNVAKSFGPKKALNGVTLQVKRGEIFGFLGPNGAGKTTTIRVLLDILRPDEGSVRLFGASNRLTELTHRRLGYLSGDMVLENDLTGQQYLTFVSNRYGGNHQARIRELANALEIKLTTKIGNYSRGNKQKIGLIATLMHTPDLLILDEPTSGFDPLIQETFIELMRHYQAGGGTIFMSSHILGEVQQLCHRVAFIKDGSILATRTIEELTQTATKQVRVTAEPKQVAYLKEKYKNLKQLVLLQSLPNVLTFSYSGNIRDLLKYFADRDIRDITIQEPEMETVFLDFYKETPSEAEKS